MDENDGLAPVVSSILAAAKRRESPGNRIRVDAKSIPDALATARAEGRVPVIAEVKPSSPRTDRVRRDDPVELATSMVAGGAAALSVLTEPEHFGGSPAALEAVREAVPVPVIRKDFVLEPSHLDVVEADAVLLIVRFLSDLSGMIDAVRDRGMEPLVEVHTGEELERALEAGATLIGVNNRDLATLEVDRSTFARVRSNVPEDVTLVAESGIRTREHARTMLEAGASGLLIGEAIMDGDVRDNTERFVHA
ncbi:MAG: indole-3-glycerol-phosphate synthase [Halodesulfurarchaeum sp.]